MSAITRKVFFLSKIFWVASILCVWAWGQPSSKGTPYTLDVPEGFAPLQSADDSYLFYENSTRVSLLIREANVDETASRGKNFLRNTLDRLCGVGGSADYTMDIFEYCKRECAIAKGSTRLITENSSKLENTDKDYITFWALGIPLDEGEASPSGALVLVCYCAAEAFTTNEQFIVSALNSLDLHVGATVGPFCAYAFPSRDIITHSININNTDISVPLTTSDEAASRFLVDCEYAVLLRYSASTLREKAWQRYYRAIYRDSYARLKGAAASIRAALLPATVGNKNNYASVMNNILLNWVQGFSYARNNTQPTDSDFTPLPCVLTGSPSDCDSRSMLMCVLLNHLGIPSVFFVSSAYHHAIYGASVKVPGAKILVGDTWYLLGETTAKNIAPGLIQKDMTDSEMWLPVTFD